MKCPVCGTEFDQIQIAAQQCQKCNALFSFNVVLTGALATGITKSDVKEKLNTLSAENRKRLQDGVRKAPTTLLQKADYQKAQASQDKMSELGFQTIIEIIEKPGEMQQINDPPTLDDGSLSLPGILSNIIFRWFVGLILVGVLMTSVIRKIDFDDVAIIHEYPTPETIAGRWKCRPEGGDGISFDISFEADSKFILNPGKDEPTFGNYTIRDEDVYVKLDYSQSEENSLDLGVEFFFASPILNSVTGEFSSDFTSIVNDDITRYSLSCMHRNLRALQR